MIVIVVLVLISLIWTVYFYGSKVYQRRWLEAFIDSAGIFPWPILVALGFWFVAALAKIWNPESDNGRRWFNAGLIVGSVALLLGWFLRAVLWAAPDALWPENENINKVKVPAPPAEEKKP